VDELQYKNVEGARFLVDGVLAYLDADDGQDQRQQNPKPAFFGERGPCRLFPVQVDGQRKLEKSDDKRQLCDVLDQFECHR
jgi:hypothetical protein